jgi:FtsP/CotA-like multicopper oxidase with cupredoxin domain
LAGDDDAARKDLSDRGVRLGDTEEWTVVNTDQQYHSFHIHQTPFLVTEVGGVSWHGDSLRNTFSVPPATGQGLGVLKVVIPFTDPVIVGRLSTIVVQSITRTRA